MNFFNKGNRQKFPRWIDEYHQALFQHAYWMTGNRDLAADMVQEAYFQAWQSIHTLKDQEKVFAWLLTILRRVIYKEQRHQYQNRETVAELESLDVQSQEDDGTGLMELYRMLEKLSPQHREVFLLYFLQDFTYQEISDHLKIPVGTVMSRLSRAREKIRSDNISTKDNIVYLKQKRGINNGK